MGGLGTGAGWGGGLGVQTNGALCAFNQQNQNLLGGTINVCDNQWHWVETKNILPAGSTVGGTFQWFTDIIEGGTAASVNMFGVNVICSWGYIYCQGLTGASALTTTYDYFFCYDSNTPVPSGSGFPLGPRAITTIRPSGDSAVQFAPNSGITNYTQVNEVAADDDTTYVQDATSGDQDLYTYADLPFTPQVITGAMLNARLKNPGSGTQNYQLIGKSGATHRNGTSTVAPSAYVRTTQLEFGVDPNTSAAWTPSNLNSATFGIKVP
jgi:hypothetical protein